MYKNSKKLIKETALEMFNDRGIENVGVREIGRQLGMSPGNVSYYYPSKNDLIIEVYRDFVQTAGGYFSEFNAASVREPDDLLNLLKQSMAVQHSYRCLFQSFNILTQLPELAESVNQHDALWREGISGLFAVWREAGLVHRHVSDSDVSLFFSLVKFIMVYRFTDARIHHPGKTPEEADRLYGDQIVSLLNLFVAADQGKR